MSKFNNKELNSYAILIKKNNNIYKTNISNTTLNENEEDTS
jgi:hypothetical protein